MPNIALAIIAMFQVTLLFVFAVKKEIFIRFQQKVIETDKIHLVLLFTA